MNKDIKKECVLDSIRCWALSNGYQEITDDEDENIYGDIDGICMDMG